MCTRRSRLPRHLHSLPDLPCATLAWQPYNGSQSEHKLPAHKPVADKLARIYTSLIQKVRPHVSLVVAGATVRESHMHVPVAADDSGGFEVTFVVGSCLFLFSIGFRPSMTLSTDFKWWMGSGAKGELHAREVPRARIRRRDLSRPRTPTCSMPWWASPLGIRTPGLAGWPHRLAAAGAAMFSQVVPWVLPEENLLSY